MNADTDTVTAIVNAISIVVDHGAVAVFPAES